MRPIISKGVANQYAGPTESIYDVTDGTSGGLISVGRLTSTARSGAGSLLISAYRLDSDVKVQAPAENLLLTDAILITAQRVMELTSTALANHQLPELERRLLASDEFAALLQRLTDEVVS